MTGITDRQLQTQVQKVELFFQHSVTSERCSPLSTLSPEGTAFSSQRQKAHEEAYPELGSEDVATGKECRGQEEQVLSCVGFGL